jgi:hypothetical protein
MSVIFHIGFPKTGTTWFQKELFPVLTNSIYIDKKTTSRYFVLSDVYEFDPLEIKLSLNFSNNSNYIFSSEGLSTQINNSKNYGEHSKTYADKIKATFPNAKIIIFIRNQQSIIPSAYSQYLKNGGVVSFKKYLYTNEVFNLKQYYYHNIISYYDLLFGRENVEVFLFEEFKKNPALFVEDICKRFQLTYSTEQLNFTSVNQSLRVGLIPLVRVLNLFHKNPLGRKRYIISLPYADRFVRYFIRFMNKYSVFGKRKTSNSLNKETAEFIYKCYHKSNNILANRVGYNKLKEFGYPL